MISENGPGHPAPYGAAWDEWTTWANDLSVSQRIGLRCVRVERGRADLVLDKSDWPLNQNGAVHGGMVIGCADHCFGVVATTVLDAEHVPATSTFTAELLRPAFPPLTFEAVVDRVGRTLVFVTVTVSDRTGKTCTKVSGTMVIDGSSRHAL